MKKDGPYVNSRHVYMKRPENFNQLRKFEILCNYRGILTRPASRQTKIGTGGRVMQKYSARQTKTKPRESTFNSIELLRGSRSRDYTFSECYLYGLYLQTFLSLSLARTRALSKMAAKLLTRRPEHKVVYSGQEFPLQRRRRSGGEGSN